MSWFFNSPVRYIQNSILQLLGYITLLGDNENYYISNKAVAGTNNNTTYFQNAAPFKGIIKTFFFEIYVNSTLGSAENISLYLYRVSDNTSTLLGTIKANQKGQRVLVENLNIPVEKGELISLRIASGNMVTNPAQLYCGGYFFIENE